MTEATEPQPELTDDEVIEQKAVRLAKRDRLNEGPVLTRFRFR